MAGAQRPGHGESDVPQQERTGGWLGPVSQTCLRLLIVAVAVVAVVYVAAALRLVVLPLALAVVLATFLHPAVRWLTVRRTPDALAAGTVLLVALLAAAAVLAVVVPQTVGELAALDVSLTGGVDVVQRWLTDGPLGASETEVNAWVDRAEDEIRDNAGNLTRGVVTGAAFAAELLTGLALAVVLLFFLLKDGRRICAWLLGLVPAAHRDDAEAIGERSWTTLGGYLRGVTLVALFDAVFIGLALLIIGVPLVVPLTVLTFIGAFVPIVGAFVAGIAAVLVALVSLGPVAALGVAAAVIVVQQLEGNLFQPVVVGRSVNLHPIAILLAVTAGTVLGGIIGAVVATPLAAVGAAALRYLRFERSAGAGSGSSGTRSAAAASRDG